MGIEIERKFLVIGEIPAGESTELIQAYLSLDPDRTVRVRIDDESASITIKGRTTRATRVEFEYSIPLEDGRQLLPMAEGSPVEKIRHRIPVGDHIWEVDVFSGDNAGLIVAEIELESENESFDLPDWIGEDVTENPRYLNACLAQNPYSNW